MKRLGIGLMFVCVTVVGVRTAHASVVHRVLLQADESGNEVGEPASGRAGSSAPGEQGPDGPEGEPGRSYPSYADRLREAVRRAAERGGGYSRPASVTPAPTPAPKPVERDVAEPSRSDDRSWGPALPALLATIGLFGAAAFVMWRRRRTAG